MIPAGITTATVHLDAPVSFTGDPGRLHVVIAPSVSLIWTATGTPLGSFVDTFALAPGKELSVELPHTDQPGFEDGEGNAYTGWYYTITVVYEKDGRRINEEPKDFQIPTGQTSVDLALVPGGQAAPVPQIAPILPVTSIDGLNGALTLTDLGIPQALERRGWLAADHGVVGDGIADDAPALNALLSTAAAAGARVILEQDSVLAIKSQRIMIPSGTHLDGQWATIRNDLTASTSDALLWIKDVSDVVVENLNIDGNKAAYAPVTEWKHGISITGASSVTLRNVNSTKNKGDGVYVGGNALTYSRDIVLDRVVCDQNHRQGMSIAGVSGLEATDCKFTNTAGISPECGLDIEPNTADTPINRIKFTGCEFTGNAQQGIAVAAWWARTIKQGDVDFIGCTVDGNLNSGVKLCTGDGIRFTGGSVSNNTGKGVWFSAFQGVTTDVTFNGTEIIRNTDKGILMDVQSSGLVLNAVRCYGNTTAAAGIGLDLIPTAPCRDIKIIGCTLGGASQTHGLRTNGNISYLTLVGNTYLDAATPTSFGDDTATRFRSEGSGVNLAAGSVTRSTAGSTGAGFRSTTDTVDKILVRTDGLVTWSSGTAAADVQMSRTAANVLALGPDDAFKTGHLATASLPAAATAGKGALLFDDTISAPVWTDGVKWYGAAARLASTELTYFVTPRGNDANDGLSLMTAKATIQSAIDAAGGSRPRIQLGVGGYTLTADTVFPEGMVLEGAGRTLTSLNYTGTGTCFAPATPLVRTYNAIFRDFTLSGPGKTSTATGISLESITDARLHGVTVRLFGTGVKVSSTINGGAVYNRFDQVIATSCTTGFAVAAAGSNSTNFVGCRANACTIGLDITDSNDTKWVGGSFEANTTGLRVTASANALSDGTVVTCSRFEGNTTAVDVTSANVRDTVIEFPGTFGTFTVNDLGTRTTVWGNQQTTASKMSSAIQSAKGSWRFERTINGGTELPAVVVSDSVTTSGTPVTLQLETERSAGIALRVMRGATKYLDITAAGDIEFFTATAGPIMRSANGTRYRLTVGDDGALTTTAL